MEIRKNARLAPVNILVDDRKDLPPVTFSFSHTIHSKQRSCQRGIRNERIQAAIRFGEVFQKQGFLYYVLGERNLPESLRRSKEQYRDIVVVTSGDSEDIITCYRSSNPFRHLKRKSKKYYKDYVKAA